MTQIDSEDSGAARTAGRGVADRLAAGRVCRFAAAGLLSAAILLALTCGALLWRLEEGPISMPFLTERIATTVRSHLPDGFGLRIDDTELARNEDGGVSIVLRRVAVDGPDGERIVAAERAAIGLSTLSLLTGHLAPNSVWLIEPSFAVVASEDGLTLESRLPLSPDPGAAPAPIEAAAVLFALLTAREGEPAPVLEEIGVRDGRLSIVRPDHGTAVVEGLSVMVARAPGEQTVRYAARLGDAAGAPTLNGEVQRAANGAVAVDADIRDMAVTDLEAALPPDLPLVPTMPVSGRVSLSFAADGELAGASGELAAGAGHVGVGGMEVLIDEADFAFAWSDATGNLDIRPSTILAGDNRATVEGQIQLPEEGDFNYGTTPMRLSFTDVELGDPQTGHRAVYPSIVLEAFYLHQQRLMHVSRLDLATADAALSLVGFIGGGGESPGVRVAGSIVPMTYDALEALWPPFVGEGARTWIMDNLSAGRIADAELAVNIPPGAIAASLRGVPLPEDAFELEFGLEDVVFSYLGDMPAISGARGHARLTAGSFELTTAAGAEVALPSGETIEVGAGRFVVPNLQSDPPWGEIRLDVSGSTPALLELFDHEPVRLARKRNLVPSEFGGHAEFDIGVRLPLIADVRLTDVSLDVSGRIEGFSASSFYGTSEVRDGSLDITIADDVVSIAGEGMLDGVPAEINVREGLHDDLGDETQSVTMTLDEAARERLGIPLEDVLVGPVTATIAEVSAGEGGTSQRIEADLTNAHLDFAALGLTKRPGEAASVGFVLTRAEGQIRLRDIDFRSSAIRILGDAVFGDDGTLVSLDLPVLRTARGTDVAVSGRRENGADRYTVMGASLDLRPVLSDLSRLVDRKSGGSGTSVVALEVDEAIGDDGRRYTGVSLSARREAGTIRSVDARATTGSGAPVELAYADDGVNASLDIVSPDGGSVLAWSGIYEHMRGGRLRIAATRHGADAPLVGNLNIDGFRVADDPSLTELISAGEERTQRAVDRPSGAEQVNPSNVGFDTLSVPFQRTGTGFIIREGVLRGVTVGATLDGSVQLGGAGRLDLHGTYVPLYALNNLFGQVPLLGPLLAGRRQEGLVGITYSLTGSLEEPMLTVNPLSVVAPGLFRYILGMDNPRALTPGAGASSSAPVR